MGTRARTWSTFFVLLVCGATGAGTALLFCGEIKASESFLHAEPGWWYLFPLGITAGAFMGICGWRSRTHGITCIGAIVHGLVASLAMAVTWRLFFGPDPDFPVKTNLIVFPMYIGLPTSICGLIAGISAQHIRCKLDAALSNAFCHRCGYSREGLATKVCPECGYEFADLSVPPVEPSL